MRTTRSIVELRDKTILRKPWRMTARDNDSRILTMPHTSGFADFFADYFVESKSDPSDLAG